LPQNQSLSDVLTVPPIVSGALSGQVAGARAPNDITKFMKVTSNDKSILDSNDIEVNGVISREILLGAMPIFVK
jgi:hypothetical protein